MPSTETLAANHGQNSWIGLPLRSASSMTLMPLPSTRGAPAAPVWPDFRISTTSFLLTTGVVPAATLSDQVTRGQTRSDQR